MIRSTLCFVLVSAAAASAGQGVILKQSTEDLRNNSTSVSTSYVEQDRVAIESNSEGRHMTVVYLADGNVMRMIDHSKKTVREIPGEDLEKMMGQVNEAMAKMQEQLKNMPPQQRAMMEKMMGDRMKQIAGAGETVKPVYKRGEGSTQIGGHDCDWYEGYRGEQLFSTLCAADWDAFDLRPSDLAVFQKMTDFLAKLAPQIADIARFGGEDWQEKQMFPGVPVEQTIYGDGKPSMRSRIESVERGSIEESVYAAPDGYKIEKGMPGQR